MTTMAMTTVAMEQVQERASEQENVGRKTQWMRPVLAQKEKGEDNPERRRKQHPFSIPFHIRTLLNLRALPITLTDESAIAAAAMIGDSKSPNEG